MTLPELRFPAVLLAGLALFSVTAARGSVTENFKQSYPLNPDGVIRLDNINGDVEITVWDKAEVSLEAETRARNEGDLKKVHLDIDATATRLTVHTIYEKKHDWTGGTVDASVHFKLVVPVNAKLDRVSVVNADIAVTGVRGEVVLESVNGRIVATGLANEAELKSVNGRVRGDFDTLAATHEIVLKPVNGSVELDVPKDAGVDLHTETVNGGVSVEPPIKLSSSGRHLAGQIGTGGPHVTMKTVNGAIKVRQK